MRTIAHAKVPSALLLMPKLGLKHPRKKAPPSTRADIENIRINKKHYARFLNFFGYDNPQTVPAPYAYLIVQDAILWMMTLPEFKLTSMGLIHLRVHFEKTKPITPDMIMNATITTENAQQTDKGLTFEFKAVLKHEDQTLITIKTTSLAKGLVLIDGDTTFLPKLTAKNHDQPKSEKTLTFPSNAGRKYAWLSGDFNPIHLYPWTSRLFGFKHPIVHGMCNVCHIDRQLTDLGYDEFQTAEYLFKSPLPVKSESVMSVWENKDSVYVEMNRNERTNVQAQITL